jgi:isocitrate/isopropylmalate dehydrogenase
MQRKTIETPTIDPTITTLELLRAKADGLYRTAVECIRQQDRVAHLSTKECAQTEKRLARIASRQAREAMDTMLESYEKSSARLKPDGDDEAWWKRANAVWMAAREFARRHVSVDALAKDMTDDERQSESFGNLAMDFELEASALLALRQATDAYHTVRPQAA